MTRAHHEKIRFRAILVSVVGLATFSAGIDAAVVRGRLVHGQSAAVGVSVTVVNKTNGNTAPVIVTAADGMYYIYNVAAGAYYLEIWTAGPAGKPTRYPINVTEPLTDIPAIALP